MGAIHVVGERKRVVDAAYTVDQTLYYAVSCILMILLLYGIAWLCETRPPRMSNGAKAAANEEPLLFDHDKVD